MKTVCLTGVAGFIGFHLAKKLDLEGYRVVGIDNLNSYYDKQLKLAGGGKKLFLNAKKKFPSITLSELISDRIIIIAKKL